MLLCDGKLCLRVLQDLFSLTIVEMMYGGCSMDRLQKIILTMWSFHTRHGKNQEHAMYIYRNVSRDVGTTCMAIFIFPKDAKCTIHNVLPPRGADRGAANASNNGYLAYEII